MNSEYGFESATFIGMKKNQHGRVETPWTGYSDSHAVPVRWCVEIRAGRVLSITVEARRTDRWEVIGEAEETARALKIHPGEVRAEQVDRIVEVLLARVRRSIDRGNGARSSGKGPPGTPPPPAEETMTVGPEAATGHP